MKENQVLDTRAGEVVTAIALRLSKLRFLYAACGVASLLAMNSISATEFSRPSARRAAFSESWLPSVRVAKLVLPVHSARRQSPQISGTAKDSAGKAIPGVRVTLSELGLEVLTNREGTFQFPAVAPGRYTVTARKIGYSSPTRTITLRANASTELAFVLVQSARMLEPVTVTATSSPSEARLSSRSIGVLQQNELRNDASFSIAHTLTSLPGVRSVSTGVQIGKPMIRGLYGARVLTLEDGMRLEDYSWSDEDAPTIDARLAQRVEVIRGPASVLYGSDAMGGVINVIPEALPATAVGSRVRHTAVEVYGASNNLEGGAGLRVEGANGRIGWRASGTGRFSGSIHTPNGEVDHTGIAATTFQGSAGSRGDHSNTTLRFSLAGGEFQLLEADGQSPQIANTLALRNASSLRIAQATGASPNISSLRVVQAADTDGGPVRQLLDTRLQLVHNRLIGPVRLEAKAQWQRHSLKEVSDDCLPDVGQPVCTAAQKAASKDKPAFDLLLNTTSVDVLAHHGSDGNVHGTFGVSGIYQSNVSSGPIYLVPSASLSSVGVYALEQVRLGIVTVEGSARADHRSQDADANAQIFLTSNDSRSWNAATFNAGVVVQATAAVALVANIGSGWRAPTLFDLYSNGPNLAEARYEIGNPAMRREYDLNGEAGVRVRTARARFDATAFQSSIDNYIYTTPTEQQMSGLQLFRHVQADARFTGGEASAQVEIAAPFSLDARYDYVRASNRLTDSPLPLIPPARGALGATYRTATVSWLQGLSLRGEVEAVANQTRLDVNDLQTGSYTLVNLSADAEHRIGGRDIRFDLRVRNVGNVAYRDFLSRYKQFALDPGINVVLRVSTGW